LIFQLIQLADFGFHIDSLQIIHIRILIRQGNYITAIIGKNQLANKEFGGKSAIFVYFVCDIDVAWPCGYNLLELEAEKQPV